MYIKKLREKLGLSQAAFARMFKMSKRTVQSWEAGVRRPKAYVICMLERIMELEAKIADLEALLKEKEKN